MYRLGTSARERLIFTIQKTFLMKHKSLLNKLSHRLERFNSAVDGVNDLFLNSEDAKFLSAILADRPQRIDMDQIRLKISEVINDHKNATDNTNQAALH
jgi:hypothetical protein